MSRTLQGEEILSQRSQGSDDDDDEEEQGNQEMAKHSDEEVFAYLTNRII